MNECIIDDFLFKLHRIRQKDVNELVKIWIEIDEGMDGQGVSSDSFWFKSSLESCLSQDIPAHILIIKDLKTGNIIGMVPTFMEIKKIFRLLSIRTLNFMRFHEEYGDHYDLHIQPEYYLRAAKALLDWACGYGVGICYFKNLRIESKFLRLINKNYELSAILGNTTENFCPFIKLPNVDDYDPWSRKKFKRILKYRRKFEKNYNVRYETVKNLNDLKRIIEKFIFFHKIRFSGTKGKSSIASNQVQNSFFERLLINSFSSGNLLASYITVNGEIVSIDISFLRGNTCYSFNSAFDQDYSNYRIGSIQLLNVVETIIQKGVEILDLLQGDECYKNLWSKRKFRNESIAMFPKNRHGLVLASLNRLRNIFRKLIELKQFIFKSVENIDRQKAEVFHRQRRQA